MSNKDWTSKLRDQMTDYQEPVKHDLWAGIAQSLAQNQPVAGENGVPENHPVKRVEKEPKARVVTLKRWSAAAAAVALLGIGGSYVYLHQEDVEQGNAQLASLASSEASSASSAVSSSLSAASPLCRHHLSLIRSKFRCLLLISNPQIPRVGKRLLHRQLLCFLPITPLCQFNQLHP